MRDDIQKLTRESIPVMLGGIEYFVSPKPLRISMAWKKKAMPLVDKLQTIMSTVVAAQSDTEEVQVLELIPIIQDFIFSISEELIELVFEWESEWPKDTIIDTATEDEMYDVILEVIKLAFPFLQRMGVDIKTLMNTNANMQSPSPSQSSPENTDGPQ